LNKAASTGQDKQIAINAACVLTIIMPVLFEEEHEHHLVHNIFWSGVLPGASEADPRMPLAHPLMDAVLALLIRPDFACDGQSLKPGTPLASCTVAKQHDATRTVLLKLSEYPRMIWTPVLERECSLLFGFACIHTAKLKAFLARWSLVSHSSLSQVFPQQLSDVHGQSQRQACPQAQDSHAV
jgi:hypothetical protein